MMMIMQIKICYRNKLRGMEKNVDLITVKFPWSGV